MLRTLLRSTAALAGLITWVTVAALPVPADAETTDGTLTVIVNLTSTAMETTTARSMSHSRASRLR